MRKKPLYYILSSTAGANVLVSTTEQGCGIPEHYTQVTDDIGFEDPDSYLRWFEQQLAIPVYRKYIFESISADATVMVLEVRPDSIIDITDYTWIPHYEAADLYLQGSSIYRILSELPHHYNNSTVMPWVRPRGYSGYLRWMTETLQDNGIPVIKQIKQIKNAYVSSVFCACTDVGEYYLKISAAVFVREMEITKVLQTWKHLKLPEWISADEQSNTFLMKDMGGMDLSWDAASEQLGVILQTYAQFQIKALDNIDMDSSFPFYDLRSSSLIDHVDSIAEWSKLFEDSIYQLNDEELTAIQACLPYWKELCQRIQSSPVPDSVEHGDLRPDNIRIVEHGFIFFDWAWTAVAHPFFSATSFFHTIKKSLSDPDKLYLRDIYLKEWSAFASMDTLFALFELVEKLNDLYSVISHSRWLSELHESFAGHVPEIGSPDAWTLERRQYYVARAMRRLIV